MSTTRLLKGVWPNSQWFSNYSAPNQGTLKLKTSLGLQNFLSYTQHFVDFCELCLTKLDTDLAHDL